MTNERERLPSDFKTFENRRILDAWRQKVRLSIYEVNSGDATSCKLRRHVHATNAT